MCGIHYCKVALRIRVYEMHFTTMNREAIIFTMQNVRNDFNVCAAECHIDHSPTYTLPDISLFWYVGYGQPGPPGSLSTTYRPTQKHAQAFFFDSNEPLSRCVTPVDTGLAHPDRRIF
jgi:hypothetical protein